MSFRKFTGIGVKVNKVVYTTAGGSNGGYITFQYEKVNQVRQTNRVTYRFACTRLKMFWQTGWIMTVEVNWDAGLELGGTFCLCLSRLVPHFTIHLHCPHPPHLTVVLKHHK